MGKGAYGAGGGGVRAYLLDWMGWGGASGGRVEDKIGFAVRI